MMTVKTFFQPELIIPFLGLLVMATCSVSSSYAGSSTRNDRSGRRFDVGYTVIDLDYHGNNGKKSLTVAIWYPTKSQMKKHIYGGPSRGYVALDGELDTSGGPYPLLVFSHGYGGSGLSSLFLTEALAARGWIVAAPDHNDPDSVVRIRGGLREDYDRQGFMQHALEIAGSGPGNRDAYLYRIEELKLVIDRMIASAQFGQAIDRGRIAVGGHSFGGFTALGLCGTLDRRHDERIKAVLLFSTGAGGYLFSERELADVKIPSMYILGERERNQTRGAGTMGELAEKVYRNLSPPKYFLEIKGANHFSFNNRFSNIPGARYLSGSEEQFGIIRRYSIAFLEKYVAGERSAAALDRQDPLLSRYLSNTGTSGKQKHEP